MSPELARPPSERGGDARSDIYSLGVTLYHAVTGTVPFPASWGSRGVIRAHREDMPDAPSDRCPGLPLAVDRIVLRALAKDPALRFQSAEDMSLALTSLLARAAPRMMMQEGRLAS